MPPPYTERSTNGHKPSSSDEDRRRREARMRAQKSELDIFADPADASRSKDKRHPRRNSESSVRDRPRLTPEEEKKRRERKLRESKHGESKHGSKSKAQRKLDVIDKLDVTSIYGTGCKSTLWHLWNMRVILDSIPPRWPVRCLQSAS